MGLAFKDTGGPQKRLQWPPGLEGDAEPSKGHPREHAHV